MWGNFKTRITGTEFARHERGLYGANLYYRSEEATSFGERRVTVHGFAAEPGTLPQRDEFRGTGGSGWLRADYLGDPRPGHGAAQRAPDPAS